MENGLDISSFYHFKIYNLCTLDVLCYSCQCVLYVISIKFLLLPNLYFKVHFEVINGSQLAKMKKSIPDMPCHKIDRDEAVGLKTCKNT